MSIWGFLVVFFAIIQFVSEKYKKQRKLVSESTKKTVRLVKFDRILRNRIEVKQIQTNMKDKVSRPTFRDRENEIFNNAGGQERIVTDFIFSEILLKPKSKR